MKKALVCGAGGFIAGKHRCQWEKDQKSDQRAHKRTHKRRQGFPGKTSRIAPLNRSGDGFSLSPAEGERAGVRGPFMGRRSAGPDAGIIKRALGFHVIGLGGDTFPQRASNS